MILLQDHRKWWHLLQISEVAGDLFFSLILILFDLVWELIGPEVLALDVFPALG